jgi:23S rRNA (uracil1939-C5)-methyltransferase
VNKCQVTAASLDEAGHGVGLAEGIRVHVADLLPGERAEVAIDHSSPHKPEAWGRVVRRIGALSPERVKPACPAFGRCGGCLWQHMSYPAQLAAKHARVVAALGPSATAVSDVHPSPQLFGYRNKGKYVVAAQSSGDRYARLSRRRADHRRGCDVGPRSRRKRAANSI